MKVDVGMSGQPDVILLVNAVVVQDDMNLFIVGHVGHNVIHELDEFDSSLPLCCFGVDGSGGYLQGGEEVQGAVPLVGALQPSHYRAARCLHVTGGSFEGLHTRLLIDGQDQGIRGRIQIEADNIGCFGGKLRIRADAPRAVSGQEDAFFPQDTPYRMGRTLKALSYRLPVPGCLAGRGRLLQEGQHLLAKVRAIMRGFSRARTIMHGLNALLLETVSPLNDRVGTYLQIPCDPNDGSSFQTAHDNPGPLDETGLFRSAMRPQFQRPSVFFRTYGNRWFSGHSSYLPVRMLPYIYY